MTELLSAAFAVVFVLGLCLFAAATEPAQPQHRVPLSEQNSGLYSEQYIASTRLNRMPASRRANARKPLFGLRPAATNRS
jgi:hypothetical protein